jgi:single-stranded-DNA-specific exonuclease
LELLLETDAQEAAKKAQQLVRFNEERKDYTAEATAQAVDLILEQKLLQQPVLVIYIEDCHESVAGIVAGRIREKYYRPTLIVTKSREGLKGSARSIPGYHMQAELSRCRELLTEYGGHAMAAGFSLPAENLEKLRERLNENCTLTEAELTEKVYFDREVPLGDMTEELVQQLELMEPFGERNERPIFAKRDISIVTLALCGRENQIARLQVKDGLRLYRAVDFQCEQHLGQAVCSRYGEKAWEEMKAGHCRDYVIDILYQPEINQMFGNVEFRIIDCR